MAHLLPPALPWCILVNRWALLTSAARRGQQYAAAAGVGAAGAAGSGGQHLVVVSTAQSFANLLAARGGEGRGAGPAAALDQVDLLVGGVRSLSRCNNSNTIV